MPTKRQVKTKPEPITPAAAKTAPESTVPARRRLTEISDVIADEISDMLVHGGDSKETNRLIDMALRHMHRRFSALLTNIMDEQERQKYTEQLVNRDFPEWRAQLTLEWKRNERMPAEVRPKPATISEQIREAAREQAREGFDTFLVRVTPEEMRLMAEILGWYESYATSAATLNKVPLAEAFSILIDTRGYISVPERMEEQVKAYVACLKAADAHGCKPAA